MPAHFARLPMLSLLAVVVLLMAALPMAVPAAAAPTVRYVAPTGNDDGSNTCAVQATPCRTIGHAIAQAAAGDTINIAAGTYVESITIDKDLTLSGAGAASTAIEGRSTTIIQGESPDPGPLLPLVSVVSGVTATISGVTITKSNEHRFCFYLPVFGHPLVCPGSAYGGGVTNTGTLTVINSTFWRVYSRGVTNTGTLTVTNSTIASGSSASSGGGIYNSDGTLTVTNSTIAGNAADRGGGGGIRGGGGIYNGGTGSVTVSNSIIAGNTATNGPDCQGTVTGVATNLVQNPSGCIITGGTVVIGDPLLGPLTDNGGPTQTHALLLGSPALEVGDAVICAAAPVNGKDQRGVVRPQGVACDLGAYESDLVALPVVGGTNLTITAPPGSVRLTWDAGDVQTGYFILRTDMDTQGQALFVAGADATGYVDATAASEIPWCYAVIAMNGETALGVSDLECVVLGFASGSAIPGDFTLALHESSTASLTWTAPAGGVDAYALGSILTGGSEHTTRMHGAATVAATQEMTVPTCFMLGGGKAGVVSNTNVLCGVPGFSTFGAPGATALKRPLGDVAADLGDRLAGLQLPVPVAGLNVREE